ncbi:MAG: hypothetical protein LBU34_16300 [Planctomycetaceae bacterium]|jgi:hypothetical protein|nr:hypothetical protein [Planctomycetaceae bacterium]
MYSNIKANKNKIIKRVIVCVIFFVFLLIVGSVYYFHRYTFIYEKTRFFDTPKEIEHLSSSTRQYEHAAEMKMSETYFLKIAKKEKWLIKRIKNSFKIIRYNFAKQNCYEQILMGKPENEIPDSCYHYIKNGYYYIDETNLYYIHVGYDLDNGMCYVYYHRRGKGPLSQRDMNPDF